MLASLALKHSLRLLIKRYNFTIMKNLILLLVFATIIFSSNFTFAEELDSIQPVPFQANLLARSLNSRQFRCPTGKGLCPNNFCCSIRNDICCRDGCCKRGQQCVDNGCCPRGSGSCPDGRTCCPFGTRCTANGRCLR